MTLYTHVREGGEYEFLGVSQGEGRTNMETRTVYRNIETGELHHRLPSEFSRVLAQAGSTRSHEEILRQALELRADGKVIWRTVAHTLGVTTSWLHHALDEAGLVARDNRRPLKATPELVMQTIELRKQRVSWKRIERELGVNQHTLRRAMYDGRHIQVKQDT